MEEVLRQVDIICQISESWLNASEETQKNTLMKQITKENDKMINLCFLLDDKKVA